jgi:UDP-N-acetylmuramate dehydrogenase
MFYQNISLKPYNTFGIDVRCNFFAEVTQTADLAGIIASPKWQQQEKLILGGGSNLLLSKNFAGLVVKINLLGIEKIAENDSFVWLKVGAGENWHQFVCYAIDNDWGGIENLSLIYGTVGASPMQNIGAYGVEIKDVFEKLEAIELETGKIVEFSHADCQFGYRQSIFKNSLKNKFVILSVTFRLTKKNHQLQTSYGAITQMLEKQGFSTQNLSLRAISNAIIAIRQSKLPNPAELGNAGSFFKNPEISRTQFADLQAQNPTMPHYSTENAEIVKVPAAWLIEQCGWKGKKIGNTGVHHEQALVLVNYGNATGNEIWELAQKIQHSVIEKFAIALQMEVNVY